MRSVRPPRSRGRRRLEGSTAAKKLALRDHTRRDGTESKKPAYNPRFIKRQARREFRAMARRGEGLAKPLHSSRTFHFAIPLKAQDRPVEFGEDFKETLRSEYAVRYLEQLGVAPTAETIKLVEASLPLDSCDVTAAWKSRGWLADYLYISPGGGRRVLSGSTDELPAPSELTGGGRRAGGVGKVGSADGVGGVADAGAPAAMAGGGVADAGAPTGATGGVVAAGGAAAGPPAAAGGDGSVAGGGMDGSTVRGGGPTAVSSAAGGRPDSRASTDSAWLDALSVGRGFEALFAELMGEEQEGETAPFQAMKSRFIYPFNRAVAGGGGGGGGARSPSPRSRSGGRRSRTSHGGARRRRSKAGSRARGGGRRRLRSPHTRLPRLHTAPSPPAGRRHAGTPSSFATSPRSAASGSPGSSGRPTSSRGGSPRGLRVRVEAAAAELQSPLQLTLDDVSGLQRDFVRAFPWRLLAESPQRSAVERFLTSPLLLKLVLISCRYLYVELRRAVLQKGLAAGGGEGEEDDGDAGSSVGGEDSGDEEDSHEAQFIDIMQLFHRVEEWLRKKQCSRTLHMPVVLLSLRTTVDTVFRTAYPLHFRADDDGDGSSIALLHSHLSQLFDPHGFYAHLVPLESTPEALRLKMRGPRRKSRVLSDRFYQTSAVVHSLFPKPASHATRHMLKHRGLAPRAARRRVVSPPLAMAAAAGGDGAEGAPGHGDTDAALRQKLSRENRRRLYDMALSRVDTRYKSRRVDDDRLRAGLI